LLLSELLGSLAFPRFALPRHFADRDKDAPILSSLLLAGGEIYATRCLAGDPFRQLAKPSLVLLLNAAVAGMASPNPWGRRGKEQDAHTQPVPQPWSQAGIIRRIKRDHPEGVNQYTERKGDDSPPSSDGPNPTGRRGKEQKKQEDNSPPSSDGPNPTGRRGKEQKKQGDDSHTVPHGSNSQAEIIRLLIGLRLFVNTQPKAIGGRADCRLSG
jgi:hypothetical protein